MVVWLDLARIILQIVSQIVVDFILLMIICEYIYFFIFENRK